MDLLSRLSHVFLLILILTLLPACSGEQPVVTAAMVQETEQAVDHLQKSLREGQLRHAAILTSYASALRQQRPELGSLVEALASEATPGSPRIQSLRDRLQQVRQDLNKGGQDSDKLSTELTAIREATRPETYNDSLTDPINVLADLSNGKLARINAPNQQENAQQAKDFGPGSPLIGNPQYGQWVKDPSGHSIWEWVGAFALFNTLSNFSRPDYGSWFRQRDWSYYNDVGRQRYGSWSDRDHYRQASGTYQKPVNQPKSYGQMSESRRASSYASRDNQNFTPTPPAAGPWGGSTSSVNPPRASSYGSGSPSSPPPAASSAPRTSSYASGSSGFSSSRFGSKYSSRRR